MLGALKHDVHAFYRQAADEDDDGDSVELILIDLTMRTMVDRRTNCEIVEVSGARQEVHALSGRIIRRRSGKTAAIAYVVAIKTCPIRFVDGVKILITGTYDNLTISCDQTRGCSVIQLEFPEMLSVGFFDTINVTIGRRKIKNLVVEKTSLLPPASNRQMTSPSVLEAHRELRRKTEYR